jgi:hypothetical protein
VPIIGPPEDQPRRRLCEPAEREQVVDQGAERGEDVARRRHGCAVDGDDALDQRLPQTDGLVHGGARRDVVHQHADLGRARIRGHFLAGQGLDQLFVRTHRVARGHRPNLHFRVGGGGSGHRRDGFGLVVLDADQGFVGADGMHDDARAVDHLLRKVAHDAVVARNIGLTLAAIDDQRAHAQASAQHELDSGREGGAAEADHPRRRGASGDFLGRQGKGIGNRVGIDPAVGEIGFNRDRGKTEPGWMRSGHFGDGGDGAGHRGVDRRRDVALRLGQQLPLENLLADQDHRPRGATHMLLQGHMDACRLRQHAQRNVGRGALVVVGMHAPARFLEEAFDQSHGDSFRR